MKKNTHHLEQNLQNGFFHGGEPTLKSQYTSMERKNPGKQARIK
jgi:hypothetical protein